MRRLRSSMILGAMALAFSGCLSPSPDSADSEFDEMRSAASLDGTAATDRAQVAAQAATPAALHGPLPFDPCPCTNPVCRPGCKNPVKAPPPAEIPPPAHGPLPFDPCPCDQPICRPGCKNPVKVPPPAEVPAPAHGPLPFDPCPCTDPVCRPVCKNP